MEYSRSDARIGTAVPLLLAGSMWDLLWCSAIRTKVGAAMTDHAFFSRSLGHHRSVVAFCSRAKSMQGGEPRVLDIR
jgi:hypothetical protein